MSHITRKRQLLSIDRLHFIFGVFFLLAVVIVVRLFNLQVLEAATRYTQALDQRSRVQALEPTRGNIITISGIHTPEDRQPLALNEKRFEVFAVPVEVEDPESTLSVVADLLGIEVDEERLSLLFKLQKSSDPYEPMAHAVEESVALEIEKQSLPGIYIRSETIRYYPLKELFGHVTGFLGFAENSRIGQYGIEGYFERILSGTAGSLESEFDLGGRLIVLAPRAFNPASDGADIVLTLDPNIQQKSCSLLSKTVDTYEATSGTIIVMEPDTGKLRSLCNIPQFNPNQYSKVTNIDQYINSAVTSTFEPGSIFKAITMAAALDSGSVSVDTQYTDTGEVQFGEHIIRNAANRIYGEQTMSQVLENSINTGMVFAAMQVGIEKYRDYVQAFGFGEPTGIELPAEAVGDVSSLDKRGDIFLATASFGQGITVTPIQMVQAFGTFANQGTMMAPQIIEEIQFADGNKKIFEPRRLNQVISTQTAAVLSAMLVNVIEKGYGSQANVPGFYMAGKTGTAQIAGENGYSDETIHSFVGFGPISDPRFVILIKLDKPKWGRFSSDTVAPVFGELARFLLHYYQVPPER